MQLPDTPVIFDRILIMGNGGAGKTWLARRLGERLQHPIIHLDDMHWEPGRYGIARDRALRDEMVKAAAEHDAWIMEGVYGQLVNIVLNRVTALIWIDLPEEACIANVKARGIQGGESQTQFDGLLKWVAEYRTRTNNWNSFEAHARLFAVFPGPKLLLSSREAVTAFADDLSMDIVDRRQKFEMRRQSDDLVYTFVRKQDAGGRNAYQRQDKDIWVSYRPKWGWVIWDDENDTCLGRPWSILPCEQGDYPPEGDWVSRKGSRSYVYTMVYVD